MFGEPGDIKLAALAVSEPQGGSDVAGLQTRARKDGEDWVLDGEKIWIGNGGIADVTIVNAVVDPSSAPRARPCSSWARTPRAWSMSGGCASSGTGPRTPPS